jgi:uncharacterized protein
MYELIERLKQSPFADDIMIARFKPIIEAQPQIASQREGRVSASLCNVCTYNDDQIEKIMSLQQKTFDTGFPIEERPIVGPCEYHQRHSMTIGPDGTIYKCPAFVGLHNLAAGHVSDDHYSEQGEWQLATTKWDEECEDCAYLPNCAGGCRYNAVNKTGSLTVKSCEAHHLERMTESFMQREIIRLSAEPSQNEVDVNALPVYSAA